MNSRTSRAQRQATAVLAAHFSAPRVRMRRRRRVRRRPGVRAVRGRSVNGHDACFLVFQSAAEDPRPGVHRLTNHGVRSLGHGGHVLVGDVVHRAGVERDQEPRHPMPPFPGRPPLAEVDGAVRQTARRPVPHRPLPRRSSTKPGLPRSGRTPEQPPTEPSEARSRRDGCGQHPGDEVRLHACATCVAARRGHRGVLAVLRGHLTDSPLPDRLHIHIVLPASRCRERTTPRAGEPRSAAAHAGTTRPSRTPPASPRSPPPRSPRSGRRARTPGSARPGRSARRP